MKDPFEEFEFKPLTEGLGFHKKTEKPTEGPLNLKNLGVEIIEDSPLNPPLPRQNKVTPTPTTDSSAAVDEILQTLRAKRAAASFSVPLSTEKQSPQYKPTVSSLSALFLDSMLILAGSLLCM